MNVLTYPYLGSAVKLGQPLGCDPTGWPYQVVRIEHRYRFGELETKVSVEPWPIPGPGADETEKSGYRDAMAHARDRSAGVIK